MLKMPSFEAFVPFAKTKLERTVNNDPRPSIEERYPSFLDFYFTAFFIVNDLAANRYLLPDDANRVFHNALNDVLRFGLVTKDAFAVMMAPGADAAVEDADPPQDGDGGS